MLYVNINLFTSTLSISWHTTVIVAYDPLYFFGIIYSLSFISDFVWVITVFFLHDSSQTALNFVCFLKNQVFFLLFFYWPFSFCFIYLFLLWSFISSFYLFCFWLFFLFIISQVLKLGCFYFIFSCLFR